MSRLVLGGTRRRKTRLLSPDHDNFDPACRPGDGRPRHAFNPTPSATCSRRSRVTTPFESNNSVSALLDSAITASPMPLSLRTTPACVVAGLARTQVRLGVVAFVGDRCLFRSSLARVSLSRCSRSLFFLAPLAPVSLSSHFPFKLPLKWLSLFTGWRANVRQLAVADLLVRTCVRSRRPVVCAMPPRCSSLRESLIRCRQEAGRRQIRAACKLIRRSRVLMGSSLCKQRLSRAYRPIKCDSVAVGR